MIKILTVLVTFFIILGAIFFVGKRFNSNSKIAFSDPNKIIISSSFYPLANFAEKVGGDLVQVVEFDPSRYRTA